MSGITSYSEAFNPLDPARQIKSAIASELYKALERLGADPELLSIVGSWNDTLSDPEILELLKAWNQTEKVIHERQ